MTRLLRSALPMWLRPRFLMAAASFLELVTALIIPIFGPGSRFMDRFEPDIEKNLDFEVYQL
jgi:hypothetical protein